MYPSHLGCHFQRQKVVVDSLIALQYAQVNLPSDFIMNRKKKIKSILIKKQKKKNAKLTSNNKPKYISKADRQAMEEQQPQQESSTETE